MAVAKPPFSLSRALHTALMVFQWLFIRWLTLVMGKPLPLPQIERVDADDIVTFRIPAQGWPVMWRIAIAMVRFLAFQALFLLLLLFVINSLRETPRPKPSPAFDSLTPVLIAIIVIGLLLNLVWIIVQGTADVEVRVEAERICYRLRWCFGTRHGTWQRRDVTAMRWNGSRTILVIGSDGVIGQMKLPTLPCFWARDFAFAVRTAFGF